MALSDLIASMNYDAEGNKINSSWAKGIKTTGISKTSEFIRILNLPRRNWETAEDLNLLVAALTDYLRVAEGTMTLRAVQAASLRDMHDVGGFFGPIAVGAGKAFITLLAPVVMEAERPLLIVPAQLRNQTNRKVLPLMRKHWRLHPKLRIIGSSELSLAKNAKILDEIQPDLIIIDECHEFKNLKAARTRRLKRWMHDRPETKIVAVSGTVTMRSIKDYWHILLWALKPDWAPLPVKWREVQDWADALDEGVPEDKQTAPGALLEFCKGKENVRKGYRRRLVETPGVVATTENDLGVSIQISRKQIKVPGSILSMIQTMRNTWETPGGDMIREPVELWRHARELAVGFWYRWDPPPPREWREARKAWGSLVREILTHNRRGLDTPLMVWNECERMKNPPPEFLVWLAVRDTFKPNTVPVWESDYMIDTVAEWLSQGPGICWFESIAFGARLREKTNFKVYGPKDDILDASGPIAASQRAHSTGKNLQQYHRNLLITPPPSGKDWEQLMGRTHRQGQLADTVTFEVCLHLEELQSGFDQARSDAIYLEETLGSRQKLNYADYGKGL